MFSKLNFTSFTSFTKYNQYIKASKFGKSHIKMHSKIPYSSSIFQCNHPPPEKKIKSELFIKNIVKSKRLNMKYEIWYPQLMTLVHYSHHHIHYHFLNLQYCLLQVNWTLNSVLSCKNKKKLLESEKYMKVKYTKIINGE